ncbi:hypothetical protein M1P97_20025 [Parabacteroides sp. GYB001]|uniref:hypothetical protein n=1 Tax=Parabacteroides leei TaxID=2939491 RepID=UPI002017C31A|nr:hypothetical protein [Parabacteroides leei]MCL3853575.1 hypothetical protein [Parabacteroides leei]
MKVKVDVRSRTGYNDVGDVHIGYEINQTTGNPVSSIRANIERSDKRIGTVTVERDGRMYISFDYANDISFETKRQVLTTVLTDAENVFNEPVNTVE